ncbi:hypothetical protein Ahy_B02g058368 [Arachis hypogaea]|uniref:Uncharacterized protein n=1 Tax=Arachis hypogaea TaxID=3818 RepID=A0A445AEI3_ARAHY|nr:hypothetical protein Ahy_B02g058368 [Arachis hypogaea]
MVTVDQVNLKLEKPNTPTFSHNLFPKKPLPNVSRTIGQNFQSPGRRRAQSASDRLFPPIPIGCTKSLVEDRCDEKESEDTIQKKDDATIRNNEVPNHTGIPMEEIPYVGLGFDSLQRAQEFYSNYAKKVGFVTKIKNTNFDKTRNELKLVTKLELKHTHACSAEQAVHYSEYRELTMHAKCVIQNNDEAGIRPNTTYLALANEVGGSSKLGYSEKDVRNYITRNLHCADVNEDVKKMIRYFVRMRDINLKFFYAVDVDKTNKFKSMDFRLHLSLVSTITASPHYSDVLCWKIPHKLRGYAKYGKIDDKMHGTVWNARSKESFEKDWCAFVNEFNLHKNKWISDLYEDRRMWVPIYFQGEFWAGMRSTQRSESMHVFFGGYLHCKSGLVQFVHEYNNVLGNKEKKKLEDDAADSKGVVPCSSSSTIERQFQREYTTSKFREVQHEFSKRGVTQEGDLFRVTVNEQYLLYGKPRSWKYSVEFDPKTHKVRCECNMFRSRAQDFVTCEEAAMLHSGLDQLRSKLLDYRANLVSRRVPSSQNSTVTQGDPHLGESDIQSPSKISTKGWPRMKRLGSELDASIKNSMRRKKKNPPLDVHQALNQDVVGCSARRANESQEHGGFLSLLNSFRPT